MNKTIDSGSKTFKHPKDAHVKHFSVNTRKLWHIRPFENLGEQSKNATHEKKKEKHLFSTSKITAWAQPPRKNAGEYVRRRFVSKKRRWKRF